MSSNTPVRCYKHFLRLLSFQLPQFYVNQFSNKVSDSTQKKKKTKKKRRANATRRDSMYNILNFHTFQSLLKSSVHEIPLKSC